jgi:D-alanyl-D-alanine carboxypeptidase
VQLKIISAYRSFGEQATLKAEYKVTYGSGANAFSADQGYSEHQLGTAIDLTTDKDGNAFSNAKGGFDSTNGYTWMNDNAYKYGFVLSYPKGNAYYQYEPWHWRFVGVALATRLHDNGQHFYDLDQREIDGYLALMFN